MSRAIIPAIVAVLILASISAVAQTSKPSKSPELKVLDRLLGSWRLEIVEEQANGDEYKSTPTGVGKWLLQGNYLEFRITDSDGEEAILHFFNYDSDARVYNMWSFKPDSQQPTLHTWQWDESEKTLTGKGDLGDGMTMQAATHFIADDRFEYTGTRKDASGNVLGEMKGKVFRKKYGDMSTETQPPESPVSPKSPELNVLDRWAGSWRCEAVRRQANGEEKKSTVTSVAKWSLQGQYLESRTTDSDGKEVSLVLRTYHSDTGVYKTWAFTADSPNPIPHTSRWNESEKTLTGEADLGNGITMQGVTHFIANDRFEWTSTMKDASGNVLGGFEVKAFRKE